MTNRKKRYYRDNGIEPAQIERDIRKMDQEAQENARIDRDLDMAGIAQTPRRRRTNPAMLAIATVLMIGGRER